MVVVSKARREEIAQCDKWTIFGEPATMWDYVPPDADKDYAHDMALVVGRYGFALCTIKSWATLDRIMTCGKHFELFPKWKLVEVK